MDNALERQNNSWPLWQKILFRFFFIYWCLFIAPWEFLNIIPGVSYVFDYYDKLIEWLVIKANSNLFHVFGIKEVHKVFNGSGDTSFSWAEFCLDISLAIIGSIIWSIIDRQRKNYRVLNYWLCTFLRFFVALQCFTYGFDKVLLLQMPFPTQSQLATPLGDFLPMRLSWMFLGYSSHYQMFSGIMECIAAALLVYRRTATLGILVGTTVFINVMMLNLSYDIPVKIFAIHLVLICVFLLTSEYKRLVCFFVLDKPAASSVLYRFSYTGKKMKIARIILKLFFLAIIVKYFYNLPVLYKSSFNQKEVKPLNSGHYDVKTFVTNKDTLLPLYTDTLRWQEMIVDKGGNGSIKTNDTIFRRRYGRGYFTFVSDTNKRTIDFRKFSFDSLPIIQMRYKQVDSNTIQLWGKKKNDSIYVELKRSNRKFPLEERQFHWLSEANR